MGRCRLYLSIPAPASRRSRRCRGTPSSASLSRALSRRKPKWAAMATPSRAAIGFAAITTTRAPGRPRVLNAPDLLHQRASRARQSEVRRRLGAVDSRPARGIRRSSSRRPPGQGHKSRTAGIRESDTATLVLEDCKIPPTTSRRADGRRAMRGVQGVMHLRPTRRRSPRARSASARLHRLRA